MDLESMTIEQRKSFLSFDIPSSLPAHTEDMDVRINVTQMDIDRDLTPPPPDEEEITTSSKATSNRPISAPGAKIRTDYVPKRNQSSNTSWQEHER